MQAVRGPGIFPGGSVSIRSPPARREPKFNKESTAWSSPQVLFPELLTLIWHHCVEETFCWLSLAWWTTVGSISSTGSFPSLAVFGAGVMKSHTLTLPSELQLTIRSFETCNVVKISELVRIMIKPTLRQYPAIHTNYNAPNGTI